MRKLLVLILLATSCVTSAPLDRPNDKEWNLILADHQWIQTLRAAQKAPPPNATRKEEIQMTLENIQKIAPTYQIFLDKVDEYFKRTRDPRAAVLLAGEKIYIG